MILFWRQGLVRQTRWRFWINLGKIAWQKPRVLTSYLTACPTIEHFIAYRQVVRQQIEDSLAAYLANNFYEINTEKRNIKENVQI